MPVIYDRIERTWRAEGATGAIVGYFPSEALALAALPAEGDTAFIAVMHVIDQIAAAPAVLTLADGTPVERRIDTDGTWLGVAVDAWHGTYISASDDGRVSFGQSFPDRRLLTSFDGDLDTAAWAALKQLVFSGVVDEMIALAQGKPPLTAFDAAQRLAYEAGRASRRLLPPPTAPHKEL